MLAELTIFATPAQALLAAGVLFLAEIVYLVFGFGVGLIALGLMALFHPDLQDIVVILMLVNLPVELAVVSRRWSSIRRAQIPALALGLVPGLLLGAALLAAGGSGSVLIPLILLLILAGLALALAPKAIRCRLPSWLTPLTGGLAGFFFGLLGAGGPPLVLHFQLQGLDKRDFRDRLMAIFLLVSLLRLPAYALGGLLSLERVLTAILLLPAIIAGAVVGQGLHLELSPRVFRLLLGALLLTLGLSLSLTSLL